VLLHLYRVNLITVMMMMIYTSATYFHLAYFLELDRVRPGLQDRTSELEGC